MAGITFGFLYENTRLIANCIQRIANKRSWTAGDWIVSSIDYIPDKCPAGFHPGKKDKPAGKPRSKVQHPRSFSKIYKNIICIIPR